MIGVIPGNAKDKMNNERSPMFSIALIIAIISVIAFLLLAVAAANGGQ